MLGSRTEADEAGGHLAEKRKPFQQMKHKRQRIIAARHLTGDHSLMNKYLHPLDQARRPFPACPHFPQIVKRNWTAPHFLREQVRRRNRILDGEIDTNATRRRHGVRRIADAKQSFATPFAQTIDLYSEQLDLRPIIQLGYTIAQKSRETDDLVLKLQQPVRFDLVEATLGNNEAALPVIAAIE